MRVRPEITLTNHQLRVEALAVGAVAVAFSALALSHDWCERLCAWLMRYERYEADELVLVALVFAGLFMGLLFRRQTQLRSQMRFRHAAEQEARWAARHDYLTGLPNRLAFAEEFEPAAAGATAILLIDLDGFKAINDTQGHAAGDEVLKAVAARLELVVSSVLSASVARLGGDEFSCVVRPAPGERELAAIGQEIVSAVGEPILLDGVQLCVTPSVGIACSDEASINRDELLHRADIAMYLAKGAGGGQVSIFGCASEDRISAVPIARAAPATRHLTFEPEMSAERTTSPPERGASGIER